jgi:hypothetical protein
MKRACVSKLFDQLPSGAAAEVGKPNTQSKAHVKAKV